MPLSTIPFTSRITAIAYISLNSLSARGASVSGLRYASFSMISTKLAVMSTATGKRHRVLLSLLESPVPIRSCLDVSRESRS